MPQHIQIGGGVLKTDTWAQPKKGGLRHGHESKKGGLKNWFGKKTILTIVTDVAQRGVLGAYLLITLTFFLST